MKLDCVPRKSTVAQMAYEIGILADLQVGEALASLDGATMSWDATTIDGSHVNEIHISAAGKTLAVDVRPLPGGKTVDYIEHISVKLKDIVNIYCKYINHPNSEQLYKTLISTIKSTVTGQL